MTTSLRNDSAVHHEMAVHELVVLLESDLDSGLTEREAHRRLQAVGPNELPPIRSHGPIVRFLLQFHNPLIYVLLASVVITLVIGEYVDASVIFGVVIVNAIVGFIQEQRATKALEALAEYSRTMAHVIRDGRRIRIDSSDLVPGDLVIIDAGDKVPADVRLIDVNDLAIDESALTGESEAVRKNALQLPTETILADRCNMAYSSTLVTAGNAHGIVVDTGANTEIGRIHALVGTATGVATPLTQRLAKFSKWLTWLIIGLAAITLIVGVVRGESFADMVTAAVALAVGAIPEGLPAAVTITLAIGVSRMAKRHAIIRKLPAAETLGSTTVICTDKTGTLTLNQMTVQRLFAAAADVDIADATTPLAHECLIAGVLCNNARSNGIDDVVGEPTEVALLVAAARNGLDQHELRRSWPRIAEIPFSSDNGWMATVNESHGERVLWVKGGTEVVVDMCDRERGSEARQTQPIDREGTHRQAIEYGEHSLRVLAFARTTVPDDWSATTDPLPPLEFLGLQAMADPLRPEAISAVAACQTAGISVKMITGDHPRTAAAIAKQAGFPPSNDGLPAVLTGADVATASDDELVRHINDIDVFARVSADQKLRIVEALQANGHVVAMTGDGINDAPALKQADIGIAMGFGGTEVAKESSDMILADDNFATIEAAVEEGRSIYDNLVKFITWTLPTNIGEGLVIVAAIMLGTTLPITPLQILWVNMTTAVALGLMLAFEPGETGIMRRPPRAPRQPILTAPLVRRMLLVGTLMLIGAFGLFEWSLASGASVETARTIAVNAFVAMEIGYLLNCRSLTRSFWSMGLFSNRWLLVGVAATIVLQLLFTYAPWLQVAFGTTAIPLSMWLIIIGLGIAVTGIVGGYKIAGNIFIRHLPNATVVDPTTSRRARRNERESDRVRQ